MDDQNEMNSESTAPADNPMEGIDLTLGSKGAEAADGAEPARQKREINYIHGEAAKKYGWWWGTGRRKTAVAAPKAVKPQRRRLSRTKASWLWSDTTAQAVVPRQRRYTRTRDTRWSRRVVPHRV